MNVQRPLLVLISSIVLAGCGLLSPATTEPQATQDAIGTAAAQTVAAVLPTNAPSSTPVPTLPPVSETATPEATLTPIGGATATPLTPTAPPTPDPNLNVTDVILYEDTFDGRAGWFWTFEDDVAAFGAVDGELRIQTKQGNNTWRYILRDDVTAADMQVRITARALACPGNDEYGLMFRGRLNAGGAIETYILKLNCAGQIRLEILDNVDTIPLRDWESFPALKTELPAENVLMLWLAKDQFHVYANDQYLFSLTNAALAEGFFGFYIRSLSGGGGQFVFDDLSVREIVAP